MASSFITKDDEHGFWINDALFEVTCKLLLDAAVKDLSDEDDNWATKVRMQLGNNAEGYYHSYMHLNLDGLLTDDLRTGVFIEIISSAIKSVKTKGNTISISKL